MPTLNDVAFVYFDLDDTLLDHRHAEREALADVRTRYDVVFGALSVDALQARYRAINGPLWRQYAAGEIDKATLKRERFVRLLDAVGAPHANAGLVGRHYLERYAAHWRFIPGAREAFEAVADRYAVGVLTNGFAETQAQKFDRFPVLRERTETLVVSEETGAMKPDPQVFAAAAERAGAAPGSILYVGDSYRSDVQGGQNAGWRVAWYTRGAAATGANGAPEETADAAREEATREEADEATPAKTTDARGFSFSDWDELVARLT